MKSKKKYLISALLMSVVLLTWFVLMTFPVQSFDSFYHMATGRWIAEHTSVPTEDIFSTTARGNDWITHEWAVQLGMYLIYGLGGIDLLVILKALWLMGVAGLLFELGRKLGCPAAWRAILLIAAAPTVAFRAFLRPHVVSYGFLAILLFMLYGKVPTKLKHRLVAIAVLFAVWANCHSGFVFGLFVLGVWEIFRWIGWYTSSKKRPERIPGLSVWVATLAALVNPNGYHVFLYPFKFMANSELFGMINELRPVMEPGFQGGWFIPLFFGLLAVAVICGIQGVQQGAMRELVLVMVFGYLGYTSVRNVPVAVLVILPGIFLRGGAFWRRQIGTRKWRRLIQGNVGVTVSVLIALTGGIFLTATALSSGIPTDATMRRNFGVGVSDMNFPTGSVEYLRNHSVKGNMFNTFAFGGYLLWELYPEPDVFIDGRLFVYMGEVLTDYQNVFSGAVSVEVITRKYDLSCMILAYPEGKPPEDRGLYATLVDSDEWIPVYFDDNSSVFLRKNAGNATLVARDGYRVLNPFKRTLKSIDSCFYADRAQMQKEVARLMATAPDSSIGPTIMGRSAYLEKDYSRAISNYQRVLQRHPQNHTIRRELAVSLVNKGDYADAEDQWRQVIDGGLTSGYNCMYLGISLHRQKKNDEAIFWYRKARSRGLESAELMNSMGIWHAQRGEMKQAVSFWRSGLKIDPTHSQLRNNLNKALKKRNASS